MRARCSSGCPRIGREPDADGQRRPGADRGGRVTPDFFETLGVAPARGRAFAAANGQAGGERVVILSHGLWTRRFGADPSIIGRTIMLNGISHEVLGVMPESFAHPEDAEFWVPLAPVGQFEELLNARGSVLADGHRAAEARGHARGGSIGNGRHRHAAGESVSIERRDRNPPGADARRDRG